MKKAQYGKENEKNGGKLERFIDIHKKSKGWLPPLTKYNFTGD